MMVGRKGAIILVRLLGLVTLLALSGHGLATTGDEVQKRLIADMSAGKPIVIQVVVALCDNEHQGIVPVPEKLGNGQDTRLNLYWGAAYGFRSYFARQAGYKLVQRQKGPIPEVLQKIVFHKRISRNGKRHDLFLVGEAWDGREIKGAIDRFLSLAAGRDPELMTIAVDGEPVEIEGGGASSLVAFVGHNGLMDFSLHVAPASVAGSKAKSSIVLACSSKSYFLDLLRRGGSHPLLLTTGLMAPEAYSLHAAIEAFIRGHSPARVRDAAAAAYNKYQKCGISAAKRLFSYQK